MKRTSLFKRFIAVLWSAAIVIALGGCGNGTSAANSQTASKTESASTVNESEADVEGEEKKQEETVEAVVEDSRVTWALENEENLEFNFFVFNNETQEKTILENGDRCFLKENETLMFHAKEDYSEFGISGAILQKLEFVGKSTVIVPLLDFSGEEELYFVCGDKEARIVILSEEDILISEESPEVEIPEGLTFNEFTFMLVVNGDLGDCEFIIWNPEIGSGRVITGKTASMDDAEKLIVYNGSLGGDSMNIEIIAGDVNVEPWELDRLIKVNSPGEITLKVVYESTGEEFEITCTIK